LQYGFFCKEKFKPIYFKYLGAAFGSALITSIYAIADTAMVGQYQGPDGTAALAVVAPNLEHSLQYGTAHGNRRLCSFQQYQGQIKRK